MSADPKITDLLRRLADEAISDLKLDDDSDPLCMLTKEYTRLWQLAAACNRDDIGGLIGDVSEISADLEQQIVDTVATTKTGLILQARLLTHQNFGTHLFPDLVQVVVRGIMALVPREADRRSRNAAAAILAAGG
jgi:hypothetical protein